MTDADLFVVDRQGTNAPLASSATAADVDETAQLNEAGSKRHAVWDDEDDHNEQVDLLQVPRRKKLRQQVGERVLTTKEYETRLRVMNAEKNVNRGQGTWAEIDTDDSDDDQDEDDDNGEGNDGNDDDDDDDDDDHSEDWMKSSLSRQVKALMQSTGSRKATKSANRVVKKDSTYDATKQKKKSINISDSKYNIRVLHNANVAQPSSCEVRCLEFHPSGKMILVAGRDKHLRLFHIDGAQNQHLQSVALKNFPIHSALFTRLGSRVVATAQTRHLYALDIETGTSMSVSSLTNLLPKPSRRNGIPISGWEHAVATPDGNTLALSSTQNDGRIVIVSEKIMMATGEVRLNAPVASMKFSQANDSHLYCATKTGCVYLFDVRNATHCVSAHRDQGAVHTTCLGVSPTHYACGSDSGIVNVYTNGFENGHLTLSPPTHPLEEAVNSSREVEPTRVLTNLRHPINCVEFSKDGQLMAFSTHDTKAGMRIVHVPTMTVFRNWPTERVRLHRTCSFAFSPDSRLLAIGQSDGSARLLRLSKATY